MVATANVLRDLTPSQARGALAGVLDHAPDLVGLQEWGRSRWSLMRETGSVGLVGRLAPRPRVRDQDASAYVWVTPLLGDCSIGARSGRYDLVSSRSLLLSGIVRAERQDRWLGVEPPRFATVVRYDDRVTGQRLACVVYHLSPGVQRRGSYRNDRPRLVAKHQREVRVLQRLIDDETARGHQVYALGDSNFDGLRFAGLTSAWAGREDEPGTHAHDRQIDDVHGPGRATSVTRVSSESDHRAIVVTRA